MRDITCPVLRSQRQSNTLGPDCHIATVGGCEQLTQGLVGLSVAGNDISVRFPQKITGVEKGPTGNVRMNDASLRVEKAHPGAQTIQRVRESCSLRSFEIDKPADQQRAPDMRNDKPHAPARVIVGQAIAFVTKNSK